MNGIGLKLRSDRGASITFALLLFLVCAVISSVVIVAASTAGGRLSTVREMDQRYYAATAAADVLRDRLDGQSAIVTYQKNAGGAITDATANKTGILGAASEAIVLNPSAATVEILPDEKSLTVEEIEYRYSVTGSLANGLLTCEIRVTGGRMNRGTYTIQMVFASTVMDAGTGADATEGRAKVSWKMSSLKKYRAE